MRRAKTLSDKRRKLLENHPQLVGTDNMQIEPLIRALVDPIFELALGDDKGG